MVNNLMTRRRQMLDCLFSGLPSEYQQVEWIEGTGTQYIKVTNTEVKREFEIIVMETAKRSNGAMFTGYSLWNDQGATAVFENGYYFQIRRRYNSSATTNEAYITADDALNKKLLCKCYKSYAEISEADTGTVLSRNDTVVNFLYNMPVWLFHGNSNGGYSTRYVTGRIYYAKYFQNGELEYELIPCYRKSDGEIGMYDTVSKTFYTNSGTGTFLKGADV